jgi:hypothetical protein
MDGNVDPIVQYSRSLYDYTLSLWTEFQKLAAEDKSSENPVARRPSLSASSQPLGLESAERS